jgi:imidazole glycerol phosphate synthase glutamine amidotransferase subunit
MGTLLKNKIVIIDYGAGNIKSIMNVVQSLGYETILTSDRETILNAEKIIFPGQGHFGQAMEKLNQAGLVQTIREAISSGKQFLGICLGLQVLFENSEEAPNVEGIGIFKGSVKKFQTGRTPQIGWNKISTTNANSYLNDDYFYFVNSYYVVPEDENIVASRAEYHIEFVSSVESKNVTAVQFHPEKSADAGLEFFKKWLKI